MFLSIFLHRSNISSMPQVITVCWESRQPCELQRAACRWLALSQTQSVPMVSPRSLASTLQHTSSTFLLILKSFFTWGIFTREQSRGCNSWTPRLALCPGHTQYLSRCIIRNLTEANTKKKGRKTAIVDFRVVQGVLNRTQLITYWSTDKFCNFFFHPSYIFIPYKWKSLRK